MGVRVEQPLFGENARGTIGRVGTFRTYANGRTFITDKPMPGNPNGTPRQVVKDRIAEAQIAYVDQPKRWMYWQGKYVYRRYPLWPDFFRQYIIDNPYD